MSEDAHGSLPCSDKDLKGAKVSDLDHIDDETKSLKLRDYWQRMVFLISDYISSHIVSKDLIHAPRNIETPASNPTKDIVLDNWSSFSCDDLFKEIPSKWHLKDCFVHLGCEDLTPKINVFCSLHEMHPQFKSVIIDAAKVSNYFGCGSLKPCHC